MKLQRKILQFLRTRATAYAISKQHDKEAIANALYTRFDKLCRCSDKALYEAIAEKEDKFREILPSPTSRFQNQRSEWLRLIDYATSQSTISV
jgi:hypothetical protein